jgi:hypothetical protein
MRKKKAKRERPAGFCALINAISLMLKTLILFVTV